jgi:hypothetical protein
MRVFSDLGGQGDAGEQRAPAGLEQHSDGLRAFGCAPTGFGELGGAESRIPKRCGSKSYERPSAFFSPT